MRTVYLGSGGFGVVEKLELQDGTIVAKKTLILTNDESKNSELKRRFKREVSYQSGFNHPNIVPVLDSELDGKIPWFTMPLATCSLGREEFSLDLMTKARAFLDVLNALEVVHNKGHVHRDIKPGNILRYDYPNGDFKYALSDFGLISPSDRSDTTNITSTGVVIGTEVYMARECYLNGFCAATIQSDIYSLGVLLLFLFKEGDEGLGVPYDERWSGGLFGTLIHKCTRREPNDRYRSVSELREEFMRVLNQAR